MRFNFFVSFLLFFTFLCHTLEAKEYKSGLPYLNTLRAEVGLLPFSSNVTLSRAALAHAKYLTKQQSNSHYQSKGYKGFFGRTPSDRVIKSGYHSKVVMENLSVNAKNGVAAIDNLMSAIYHRFTFLTTDKDEIGEGIVKRNKRARVSTAYVYDLGFSGLKEICKKQYIMEPGLGYIKNICRKSSKIIPVSLYDQSVNTLKKKNSKMILYPYPNQTNIVPVFYIENPHPLPGSKVSGFPVSVSFNDAYVKNVTLKSFRLFDSKGHEIKKRKILTQENDPNDKLTKYQFAFMPLKRLEYGTKYKAVFKAVVDGKSVEENWSFTTQRPRGELYKITKKKTILHVKKGTKIVLYYEPKSRKDVLKDISYKGKLKIQYLDQNTLEVTLPNKVSRTVYKVEEAKREVILQFL